LQVYPTHFPIGERENEDRYKFEVPGIMV